MSTDTESKRTEQALRHLKSIKPYDGWSTDTYLNSEGKELVMLRRRNVPLSSSGYTAIAYDEKDSQCIIGIKSYIGETEKTSFCRGVVLVEKDGAVARDQREVRVNLLKKIDAGKGKKEMEQELNEARERNRRDRQRAREAMGARNTNRNRTNNNANVDNVNMPEFSLESIMEQIMAIVSPLVQNANAGGDNDTSNLDLGKVGMIFIAVVTILRIISTFKFLLNIIVLPLLILYAMSTCPANSTFDAKKELKRVLRGHHLPEGHQDKPKEDWLSQTVARVTASVAAEAATALGHEVSFLNLGGICTVATVVVPAFNYELYWIGIFGTWKYVMKRDTTPPQRHQQ